jgi:hypothetical protein
MLRIFSILVLLVLSCILGYTYSTKTITKGQKSALCLSQVDSFYETKLSEKIEKDSLAAYPWEQPRKGKVSPITKEYFRCKGSPIHPPIPIIQDGKVVENIFDCRGAECHSLPIRHDKEYIYPILIDLLNEIQYSTGKPVIITSGHRCPVHNSFVDRSPKNQTSKHQIGAEVSFYVTQLQNNPDAVLNTIFAYYKSNPKYASEKEGYRTFERYDKEADVCLKPWFNKEIFIKYYAAHEGRNEDNRHPYPYFSIQVRFDRDTNMRVIYTPGEAQRYYRR